MSYFNLSKVEEERALELHSKSIIIDTKHWGPEVWNEKILNRVKELLKAKVPYWFIQSEMYKLVDRELMENPVVRRRYIDDIKTSGVTAISNTISTSTIEGSVKSIVDWEDKISKRSGILMKATSAEDIRRTKKEGKLAILYDFQDTIHLGYDLDNIDFFYNLGIRTIQLTYNKMNLVGVGCTESKSEKECGLSNFGYRFVERLNKLGILVDVSHCGYKTTLDTVETSKEPVVATHTGCKTLRSHDRFKTDEEIKAIAESGGFFGILISNNMYPKEDQTINHLLDQIDHIVEIVGIDYAGIGSDCSRNRPWPDEIKKDMSAAAKEGELNAGWYPRHNFWIGLNDIKGLESMSKAWPNITRGLVTRGYSDQEIKKVIGENVLRVFEKVVG